MTNFPTSPSDGQQFTNDDGILYQYETATNRWKMIVTEYVLDGTIEDTITDGVVDRAPSENAVFDALALKLTSANIEDSIVDGHTTIAPSGNAVFDALALKLTSANIEDSVTDGHTTIAPSGNAVFDALALKMNVTQPMCHVYLNANQNISTAWTAIEWTTEVADALNMWVGESNKDAIVVPAAGEYLVILQVRFQANETGYRDICITRNSAGATTVDGVMIEQMHGVDYNNADCRITAVVTCAANDILRGFAYVSYGTIPILATNTWMKVTRLNSGASTS